MPILRHGSWIRVGAWISLASALGCAAVASGSAPSAAAPGEPIAFEFYGPNHTTLTQRDVLGRVTLLAFGTSYALATQLLAEQLQQLSSTHIPRINVALIMMEPPNHEVFVATFKESLGLQYPVLLVDDQTLQGYGPFGKFKALPAAVVLDREGQVAWSAEGTLSMDRIKQEIAELQRDRP